MRYQFQYHVIEALPKLAWIARIDQDRKQIKVMHGSIVECRDTWMVEGIWDDGFELGNFHRCENFFGSGIRTEGNRVYVSTSSSPIDRLLFCVYEQKLLVSNSLILLLAYTGARLDVNHTYLPEIQSIYQSRQSYQREFKIIHPEIKCFFQVFHENIVISSEGISFEYRYKQHHPDSYRQYYELLIQILKRIHNNYDDDQRRFKFSPFATLSEGYDTTATASLVKQIGVHKVFITNRFKSSIPFSKKIDETKGARRIANKLGFDVIEFDNKRSDISEDELYFLATTIYIAYLLSLVGRIPLISHLVPTKSAASGKLANIILGNHIDLYFLMCYWATTRLSEKTARTIHSQPDGS